MEADGLFVAWREGAWWVTETIEGHQGAGTGSKSKTLPKGPKAFASAARACAASAASARKIDEWVCRQDAPPAGLRIESRASVGEAAAWNLKNNQPPDRSWRLPVVICNRIVVVGVCKNDLHTSGTRSMSSGGIRQCSASASARAWWDMLGLT